MADLKISALTAASTPLAGTEVLPIVQGGVTTKVAVSDLTAGRAVTATQLTSTVAIGTAPLVVTSTTNVANLNASSLNGATFAAPGVIGGGTASAISATSVNKVAITAPATASTLTIADGKTLAVNDNATLGTGGLTLGNSGGFTAAASKVLTANNSITLAGTDSTTQTFPTTSATIARTDAAQTFTGDQTLSANLVQGTAAKGFNFTANTPAAGMTSQLLNWYEEGAWTPVVTTWSTPPTIVSALYTRTGRVVVLSVTGVGGTCATLSQIGGLPFTPKASNASSCIAVTDAVGVAFYGSLFNLTYLNVSAATISGASYWALTVTYFI